MKGSTAIPITIGVGLVLILILRYFFRPREKRTDWLNRLSPTFRWLNAAGSILIAANRGTFRYLGGIAIPGGEKNYVPMLKRVLWEYWEIQGYEQAMEEMLDVVVDAGRLAQKVFQNWEEMMESYLLGSQFWQHEDANDPNSMTAARWALYRDLWSGKGRYRVIPYMEAPFDLSLSKEILTDQYGRMLEQQVLNRKK